MRLLLQQITLARKYKQVNRPLKELDVSNNISYAVAQNCLK